MNMKIVFFIILYKTLRILTIYLFNDIRTKLFAFDFGNTISVIYFEM